jgi:hypothetical protein
MTYLPHLIAILVGARLGLLVVGVLMIMRR